MPDHSYNQCLSRAIAAFRSLIEEGKLQQYERISSSAYTAGDYNRIISDLEHEIERSSLLRVKKVSSKAFTTEDMKALSLGDLVRHKPTQTLVAKVDQEPGLPLVCRFAKVGPDGRPGRIPFPCHAEELTWAE
jgi:hypothetical protein